MKKFFTISLLTLFLLSDSAWAICHFSARHHRFMREAKPLCIGGNCTREYPNPNRPIYCQPFACLDPIAKLPPDQFPDDLLVVNQDVNSWCPCICKMNPCDVR